MSKIPTKKITYKTAIIGLSTERDRADREYRWIRCAGIIHPIENLPANGMDLGPGDEVQITIEAVPKRPAPPARPARVARAKR